MTEQEWLASEDPHAMLTFVVRYNANLAKGPGGGKSISDRKLRLFACACCRQIWHHMKDERSRNAVEAVERYADSLITADELRAAWNAARDAAWNVAWNAAMDAAMDAARNAVWDAARVSQANLLRDIVGNPFRPLALESAYLEDAHTQDAIIATRRHGEKSVRSRLLSDAWLIPTVRSLAQAVYEERREDDTLDPARLAVLSDALEEAGCTSEELLAHLRSPGPHFRGCWALDLILGKE